MLKVSITYFYSGPGLLQIMKTTNTAEPLIDYRLHADVIKVDITHYINSTFSLNTSMLHKHKKDNFLGSCD